MRLIALILTLSSAAAVARAETFDAVPVADTYIWANFADRTYGRSPHVAVGSASSVYNDDRFQGLLRWELPAGIKGAAIRSARLRLAVRYCAPGAGTIDVYMLAIAWTEDATWKLLDGKAPWPKGYGALGATTGEILARVEVEEAPPNTGGEVPTGRTVDLDVTEIARRWAAGARNEGLLLRMVHVQYTQCVFETYSRETSDPGFPDLAPRLVIEYEPPEKELR